MAASSLTKINPLLQHMPLLPPPPPSYHAGLSFFNALCVAYFIPCSPLGCAYSTVVKSLLPPIILMSEFIEQLAKWTSCIVIVKKGWLMAIVHVLLKVQWFLVKL